MCLLKAFVLETREDGPTSGSQLYHCPLYHCPPLTPFHSFAGLFKSPFLPCSEPCQCLTIVGNGSFSAYLANIRFFFGIESIGTAQNLNGLCSCSPALLGRVPSRMVMCPHRCTGKEESSKDVPGPSPGPPQPTAVQPTFND